MDHRRKVTDHNQNIDYYRLAVILSFAFLLFCFSAFRISEHFTNTNPDLGLGTWDLGLGTYAVNPCCTVSIVGLYKQGWSTSQYMCAYSDIPPAKGIVPYLIVLFRACFIPRNPKWVVCVAPFPRLDFRSAEGQ